MNDLVAFAIRRSRSPGCAMPIALATACCRQPTRSKASSGRTPSAMPRPISSALVSFSRSASSSPRDGSRYKIAAAPSGLITEKIELGSMNSRSA